MIFVTQTNTGTMVKHVSQKQMVSVRSYPSRELFSPLFRVCYVNVINTFLYINKQVAKGLTLKTV